MVRRTRDGRKEGPGGQGLARDRGFGVNLLLPEAAPLELLEEHEDQVSR